MTTNKTLSPEAQTPMDMIYDALRKIDLLEEKRRIAVFKEISLFTKELIAESKANLKTH